MPHSVQFHRVFRAAPLTVYRAFTEADALVRWLPPHGYTGVVHTMDALVGGGYRMSFTHFHTGSSLSFGVTYVELVPGERLIYTDRFDDPHLPGEMCVTVTLKPVTLGTEVNITQEAIPDVIPADACYVGWQQSLLALATLVEADVRASS